MAWDNRVVWTEGMFLRAHHFQQADRHTRRLVRGAVEGLRKHDWGFTALALNADLLTSGKIAVESARGVMPDGSPFGLPDLADHPDPLDLGESARGQMVFLALPVTQPGGIEVDVGGADNAGVARFGAHVFEATDCNSGSDVVSDVKVARPRFRLLLENDPRDGYLCLGIGRIIEVKADKTVVLDADYIPPALTSAASPTLSGFLTEIAGLLHTRGEALAGRVVGSGQSGAAEMADFLFLQVVNAQQPVFAHFAGDPHLHPEDFFARAVGLAGELATFTARSRRPGQSPPYNHDDLQSCFGPVMAEIRNALSAVLEQTAVPIPLQERRFGVRVGMIPDRAMLSDSAMVLAVKASVSSDDLRRHFPTHVKIGSVEQIRDLVNTAVPGIKVRPLPVAPRQMPYYANCTYFELDRASQFWQGLGQSGGIALHVSGEFPDLTMELWAIRGG